MTSSLPENMTRPDFALSVRGYDRSQVDAYFGRVFEWVADAENRAASAERAREAMARELDGLRATVSMLEERAGMPAPQSMNAFGERMGQVMQSALQAAEELRVQAELEARQRHDAAAEEVEEMLGHARDESGRMVADARTAQRALEESVRYLHAARQQVLDELGALRDRLSALGELSAPSLNVSARAGHDGVEEDQAAVESGALAGLLRLSAEDADPDANVAFEEDGIEQPTGAGSADDDGDAHARTAINPVIVTSMPTSVLPAMRDGASSDDRRSA